MASMSLLAAAALALLASSIVHLLRRERALVAELDRVAERVRELSARMSATEQDVVQAVTQAEIAESVLLEKGVADEDDLEAVRRRFDEAGPQGYVPDRDGDLH
jgi:hypothetical protein